MMVNDHDRDMEIVQSALLDKGSDRCRIAEVGLEMISLLIQKNEDYGSSVWKRPILAPSMNTCDAILVRMSDKVSRIANLSTNEAKVASESMEDTLRDLVGYGILYMAAPR